MTTAIGPESPRPSVRHHKIVCLSCGPADWYATLPVDADMAAVRSAVDHSAMAHNDRSHNGRPQKLLFPETPADDTITGTPAEVDEYLRRGWTAPSAVCDGSSVGQGQGTPCGAMVEHPPHVMLDESDSYQ